VILVTQDQEDQLEPQVQLVFKEIQDQQDHKVSVDLLESKV
jgi:hypothetical protein